MNLHYS